MPTYKVTYQTNVSKVKVSEKMVVLSIEGALRLAKEKAHINNWTVTGVSQQ